MNVYVVVRSNDTFDSQYIECVYENKENAIQYLFAGKNAQQNIIDGQLCERWPYIASRFNPWSMKYEPIYYNIIERGVC